jgi:hypothetical protein
VSVVVLEQEADNFVSAWIDRMSVERRGWGDFSVVTRKQIFGRGPPRVTRRERSIRGPDALIATLSAHAAALDAELDWTTVVRRVAALDWATAAVIAKRRGLPVPRLPAPKVLLAQRSRRWLGFVRLGAEWYYEVHDLCVPFLSWVRILRGERLEFRNHYWADGERFGATWSFNDRPDGRGSLEVGNSAGGVCWNAPFRANTETEGRELDGVDLALAAAEGCPLPK